MKKWSAVALAVVLWIGAVPAQAQACFRGSCDWLGEDFYDASDWDSSGAAFTQINDPCLSFAPLNHVAHLPASAWMRSDPFFIDGNYYGATNFQLEFNLYLIDDTENWYDRLKVTVWDQTANTTEIFFISGDEYDTSCNRYVLPLTRNYLNHHVSVRFEMSWLAIGTYQIDNVAFVQY